ncbi:hypothetical protein P4B35_20830 [Pontiellaceae bacterium B12227]|nr:hypothetical protein [Pontiellaceae bacterium B12227]
MAAFIARMTEVSQRTIADDLKGKREMAPKSRRKMQADIKSFFIESINPELSSEKLDGFGLFPDRNDEVVEEVYKHHWSYQLTSLEKGLMMGQGSLKAYDEGGRIFPPESIRELQLLETANYAISEAFQSEGWMSARTVMLAEWDQVPLLNASIFQKEKEAIEGVDSEGKFRRYCTVLGLSSSIYMLALVDLGFSHDGNMATAKPFFQDLLPIQDGMSASFPVEAWLDGVGKELKLEGVNALGRALSRWKNVDEDTGLRELKRWRSGKVLPNWDTAMFLCDKLDAERPGTWWKHLVRYGAARLLQKFHTHCTQSIIAEGRDDVLKMFYQEYPKWYRHHQDLHKKALA